MRIGVAIPCYKYHLPHLKRCLDSIEAQTLKPDQVVVSCSSTEIRDLPDFQYSFPLTILPTTKRQNAAQNRNKAAAYLRTEIITFFDADDLMHPQRLEFIKFAFYSQKGCKIVLHSFLDETGSITQTPFECHDRPLLETNCLQRAPTGCVIHTADWRAPLHHAQASIHRDVFETHKFPEDSSLERREDALFCGNVVAAFTQQTVYLRNPLSKYSMEGQTHEVTPSAHVQELSASPNPQPLDP